MKLIPDYLNSKDAHTILRHLLSKAQTRSIYKVIDILSKDFQDAGELILALEFITRELNLIKLSDSLLEDVDSLANTEHKSIELIIQGELNNSIVVVGADNSQTYLDAIEASQKQNKLTQGS